VDDLRTPMWLDELYTLEMAHQAGPGSIVKATLQGADGAPPLYAIIVQSILPVVRNEALAVRLPATAGYWGMFLAASRVLPQALASRVCHFNIAPGLLHVRAVRDRGPRLRRSAFWGRRIPSGLAITGKRAAPHSRTRRIGMLPVTHDSDALLRHIISRPFTRAEPMYSPNTRRSRLSIDIDIIVSVLDS
jgi:hypothetical protein